VEYNRAMTTEIVCDDNSQPVEIIEEGMSIQYDTPQGPIFILSEEHGFIVISKRWRMFVYGVTKGLFCGRNKYLNGAEMKIWVATEGIKRIRANG
jgi:hypothetical protein